MADNDEVSTEISVNLRIIYVYIPLSSAQGIRASRNFFTENDPFTIARHCSITHSPPVEAMAEITGTRLRGTERSFRRLLISKIPDIIGETSVPNSVIKAVRQEITTLNEIITVHIRNRDREAEFIASIRPEPVAVSSELCTPGSDICETITAIVRQASTSEIYITAPAAVFPSTPLPSIISANVGEIQ